jgi:cytochrome o ubiquinol oxidase operon protein cyoD
MNQTHVVSTGASRASFKSYAAGFTLSILLTVIPFALVASGALTRPVLLFGICGAAIVQILVHLHYFLHLDTSSATRWNVMALVFAVLVITLFVGGTLWIMYHLHYRMMV